MNNRGFTLIEVLMVIGVMALLMAISAPALSTWRENAQNREVAREILAGLRQARSLAITENREVVATISPGNRQLVVNGTIRALPGNVRIETSNNVAPIVWANNVDVSTTFQPQGSCTDVLRVRVNDNPRLQVVIDSRASGLARMN